MSSYMSTVGLHILIEVSKRNAHWFMLFWLIGIPLLVGVQDFYNVLRMLNRVWCMLFLPEDVALSSHPYAIICDDVDVSFLSSTFYNEIADVKLAIHVALYNCSVGCDEFDLLKMCNDYW